MFSFIPQQQWLCGYNNGKAVLGKSCLDHLGLSFNYLAIGLPPYSTGNENGDFVTFFINKPTLRDLSHQFCEL